MQTKKFENCPTQPKKGRGKSHSVEKFLRVILLLCNGFVFHVICVQNKY